MIGETRDGIMVSYGVRGGRSVKIRMQTVERALRVHHQCPRCGKKAVRRRGTAIWICKSCNVTFAGGAYAPTTTGGEVAARIILDIRKKR